MLSINKDPQEAEYIMADCGHECYAYDKLYLFDGKWLCPDCMYEKFENLTLDEKAMLLGCEIMQVCAR